MTMENETKHVWEIAGLGQAPYTYIGHTTEHYQACPGAPIQVGGSCDFCGQGISEMYRFRSADGKVFKVGSNCVKRAGDKGLIRMIAKDVKAHQKATREARQDARIAAAKGMLDSVAVRLTALPHPHPWMAEKGKTALDWVNWMLANAGRKGKVDAAKLVEKVSKV